MPHDPVMNCLLSLVLNKDFRNAFDAAKSSGDRRKVLEDFDPHIARVPQELVDDLVNRSTGNLLLNYRLANNTQSGGDTVKRLKREVRKTLRGER